MMSKRELPARKRERRILSRLLRGVPLKRHFRINRSYRVTASPAFHVGPRRQPEYLIMYHRGAPCAHTLNRMRLNLRRGDLLLASPGSVFEAQATGSDGPSFIALKFMPFDNQTGIVHHATARTFFMTWTLQDTAVCESLFELAYEFAQTAYHTQRHGAASGALQTILASLLLAPADVPGREDSRIRRVRRIIDERPQVRHSLAWLAQTAGLSMKYFARRFRAHTGTSPHAYMINARCRYARYLLEETDQSVKQVALHLRYPDQYAFSKQFKAVTGMTPSACRRGR